MLPLTLVVICLGVLTEAKRGVVFTAPKVIVEGATEKICGSLHDFEGVDLHVQISVQDVAPKAEDGPYASADEIFRNGESKCMKLRVPKIGSKEVNLTVSAWTTDKAYSFNDSQRVGLAPRNLVTFIQTDKPIYKPGQKVKFRILTLKSDLRFRDGKFGPVYVQDPHGVRMAQWLQVTTNKGIISLEIDLSEDPVLGKWKITAEIDGGQESDTFKVDEYVLPKYEVSITPPPFVLVSFTNITITFCAKYTYGKPVSGMLTANVTINPRRQSYHFGSRRSKNNLRPIYAVPPQKINGCVTVDVPASAIDLNKAKYSIYSAKLEIVAQVKEDGTDIVLNGSHSSIKVEREIMSIKLKDSPDTFKPTLEYYGWGKVLNPDETPIPNQPVQITVKHYSPVYEVSKNVTTNQMGEFNFGLPPLPKEIKTFSINAKALGQPDYRWNDDVHKPYVNNGYHSVKQWYSPSDSYVQITPELDEQPCGKALDLEVTYTSPHNTNYMFHYQVMSRGDIVQHGHKHHHFKNHDRSQQSARGSWQVQTNIESNRCKLPKDVGPCRAAIRVWYYLSAKEKCKIFKYGGCQGNENRFNNEADCVNACVQTKPDNICKLPKEVGPCRAAIRVWYYDSAQEKCKIFKYGGCRGNENRFNNEADCVNACVQTKPDPIQSDKKHVSSFRLPISLTPEVSPNAKVLIYHVMSAGEVVADSITLKVQKCFRNKVSMLFEDSQKLPGEFTTLNVSAAPGSLCAVGVVDKSIELLSGTSTLTAAQVFDSLSRFDVKSDSGPYMKDDYCRRKMQDKKGDDEDEDYDEPDPLGLPGFPGPPARPAPVPVGRREKRSSMWPGHTSYYSEYFDSSKAFKNAGMLTYTDIVLNTRPCKSRREQIYYSAMEDTQARPDFAFSAPGGAMPRGETGLRGESQAVGPVPDASPSMNAKPAVAIRTYFPETWLWELSEIGDDGSVSLSKEVPHTVTEWVGNAFCTHEHVGLGISNTARIRGFQPFFVSFTIPYSVIRGEKVPVKITTFNYLPSECLVVKLALAKSQDFELLTGSRSHKLCVCASQAETHTFYIRPLNLGQINITVKAVSQSDSRACKKGEIISKVRTRDAVIRQLLVEPEGKEEEYTIGSYMCPDEETDVVEDIKLILPSDLVQYSERAQLSVIGDVMGPSLSGLESLLRLPTGCGEQNMLKFSPNIFVMDYLTATNQLNDEIKQKALNFLKTGYQRELNYRHDDGSYSAFGKRDPEGSTWLTAFVTKSFAQARRFIYVDPEDLRKSLMWFRFKQLENGCFRTIGTVHHKAMKGGLSSAGRSLAPLTAYVLSALLESGMPAEDEAVTNCVRCLSSQTIDDPYTTALVAYAYSQLDPGTSRWASIMEKLEKMAIKKDGLMYWKRAETSVTPTPDPNGWLHNPQAPAAEVEMTAYALLAYVIGDPENAIVKGLPIVKWLSAQRNAYGGFSSTQDTVIALQALAKYAQLAFKSGSNVKVTAMGSKLDKTFYVNDANRLLLQREQLSAPSHFTVTASGTGCAFVQAHVKYNINDMNTKKTSFELRVHVEKANMDNNYLRNTCKLRNFNVCTRFVGDGQVSESNMAIIDVRMVSGWLPVKDSIKLLMQDTALNLKKFEIEKNYIHFYFDQLTTQYTCLQFMIEQDIEVRDTKPALVKVYDYYETDLAVTSPYRIKTTCGTKEELPVLKPGEKPSLVEQSRLPVESPFAVSLNATAPVSVPEVENTCPTCMRALPEDFMSLYCGSQHAYRTVIQPPGRKFRFKVQKDLRRPPKQAKVNKLVLLSLAEGCQCSTLATRGKGRALILTKVTELENLKKGKNKASLKLDEHTTIITLNKKAFRGLRALKPRKCK